MKLDSVSCEVPCEAICRALYREHQTNAAIWHRSALPFEEYLEAKLAALTARHRPVGDCDECTAPVELDPDSPDYGVRFPDGSVTKWKHASELFCMTQATDADGVRTWLQQQKGGQQ